MTNDFLPSAQTIASAFELSAPVDDRRYAAGILDRGTDQKSRTQKSTKRPDAMGRFSQDGFTKTDRSPPESVDHRASAADGHCSRGHSNADQTSVKKGSRKQPPPSWWRTYTTSPPTRPLASIITPHATDPFVLGLRESTPPPLPQIGRPSNRPDVIEGFNDDGQRVFRARRSLGGYIVEQPDADPPWQLRSVIGAHRQAVRCGATETRSTTRVA